MTIPAGLHLMPTTPDEDEFQQWKASQGLTHDDAEFQAWKRQHVPQTKADVTSALPRNRENPTGDLQATGPAILGNLANLAQGIPGMEAVEAGARSVVRRQPYREALSDIRGQTENIPGPIKFAERAVGAAPLGGLLPGSPAVVGATLGAADPLLQASPDAGVGKRVGGAVVGAALGGATGKLADAAITKVRSMRTPDRATNLIQREADQTKAASPLYDKAIAEGQGQTQADPAIQALGRFPTVQRTAAGIRANDELGTIPPGRSPELVDKIYKGLTDEETSIEGRLMNLEKGDKSANELRQSLDNIRGIKREFLNAVKGTMPTYPEAVSTFAEHQGGIEAVKRGYQTQANAVAPSGGGVNQTELTQPGLRRWAPGASPAEREAASQGVLAKLKEQRSAARLPLLHVPVPIPSKALNTAPGMLRTINAPGQQFADLLTKLGISTANSPFANP